MNRFIVKIIALDKDDEVKIAIGNEEIECFINSCPFKIAEGESYEVELDLISFEDEVTPTKTDFNLGAVKIEGKLENRIVGILGQDFIDFGVKITHEYLFEGFESLYGERVEFIIDRIQIDFL